MEEKTFASKGKRGAENETIFVFRVEPGLMEEIQAWTNNKA